MADRAATRRLTPGGLVSLALWAILIAYAALAAHDFYRYASHWVYLSVDDGLANEAYTLASQGRYGFLSSPVLFDIERHHGEFSYGPFYFYLAAGLIWLFGYSLALVRSIHLWVILGSVAAASAWFRGPGRAASAATFGLFLLYAFGANQWPMARPDSMVSLFAVALIVCAGLGLTRGGARYWFGAGLAASCGAFSHLIASSLVGSSLVLFAVAASRRWIDAPDRTPARRELTGGFVALACGGLLGALMFYASFGFRFGDQLQLFTAYRQLVASTDSYTTVAGRHLFVAFRYLSPRWQVPVFAAIASAWIVVALARRVSPPSRALVYGYVLPPITVWTGYAITNGWYTNNHQGYAILHHVMMAWVLASLVWIAISLAGSVSVTLGRALAIVIGLLIAAQGVRQIRWQLEAEGPRAAAVSRWVSPDDYTNQVLRQIPARGTAWGSVMFGIETPDRVQLIQVSEGLKLTPRVDPRGQAALAPDYLLWGYPERRENAVSVLRGGDSLIGSLAQLTGGARYRVASLVAGAPYGVTRIYARTVGAVERTTPLPDVSVFDPDTQRWLTHPGPALPVVFSPAAPATFVIGREADPPPTRAARTVSAILPAGRYLLRITVTPGAGYTKHRLLAATSPEQRRQRIGELGPEGDFTSYLADEGQAVMLSVHAGGPLDVSQFDDGTGAGLEAIEVFPIEALIAPDEVPNIHPLPAPVSWAPAAGVRVAPIAAGGVAIEGDATKDGYQIVSPRLAADSGDRDRVSLHIDMLVSRGHACLGVLNGEKTAWLVAPDQPRADATFVKDETRGFYVVAANCNDAAAGNASTMLTIAGGRYTLEPAKLYTDRFMDALDAIVPGPADTDVSGVVRGLVTAPPSLKVTRALLDAPAQPVTPADLAFQAPIVHASGASWTIAGRAESAYSYVLQSKPKPFDANARLIVTGTVDKGGVTLGLLSRNQWAVQVNVTEPGPFTVVIAAPKKGDYAIVAANLLKASLETSFVFTKLGIVHVP